MPSKNHFRAKTSIASNQGAKFINLNEPSSPSIYLHSPQRTAIRRVSTIDNLHTAHNYEKDTETKRNHDFRSQINRFFFTHVNIEDKIPENASVKYNVKETPTKSAITLSTLLPFVFMNFVYDIIFGF